MQGRIIEHADLFRPPNASGDVFGKVDGDGLHRAGMRGRGVKLVKKC